MRPVSARGYGVIKWKTHDGDALTSRRVSTWTPAMRYRHSGHRWSEECLLSVQRGAMLFPLRPALLATLFPPRR